MITEDLSQIQFSITTPQRGRAATKRLQANANGKNDKKIVSEEKRSTFSTTHRKNVILQGTFLCLGTSVSFQCSKRLLVSDMLWVFSGQYAALPSRADLGSQIFTKKQRELSLFVAS